MIYLTGDIHGDVNRIIDFCEEYHTTKDDILILLGDVGFNYFLNDRDVLMKETASELPITLFCIRGNHEARPTSTDCDYRLTQFCNGLVYQQDEYSNIKFAIDGQVYSFNGKKCLVLGGAYSVDKFYRLRMSWHWFPNEQLSNTEQDIIYNDVVNKSFDYILSHTCPYDTRPTHLFLSSIDQSKVDNNMEKWMQRVADNISFDKWYFGHFHDNWQNDNYIMLYTEVLQLGDDLDE